MWYRAELSAILILALIMAAPDVLSNNITGTFKPAYAPTLEVPRVNGTIKVDGNLDESI